MAGLAAVLLGGAAAAVYLVYTAVAGDLVEPEAIVDTQRSLGTSRIYDHGGEDGVLLFEFANPLFGLKNPVRLHEVSQHLIDATVATEDQSFWDNEGINLRGLARAAWENFGVGSSDFLGGTGGSSITQQLVKNVLIRPEERSGRTIDRVRGKIKETILAVELTDQYSKEQILEWYLNTIYYGNLSYGIGAASQRYFGKPPAQLNLAEAAMLAGLPQAPSLYNPIENFDLAKRRQAHILDGMAARGYINQREADAAKAQPLEFDSAEFRIVAPHFVLHVRDRVDALCQSGRLQKPPGVNDCADLMEHGGLRITTTLDFALQARAEVELEAGLRSFEADTGGHNASLVALDPADGRILAMVGSRDFFREDIDGQVNLATALNSPGSALKPFTYLTAFQRDPAQWHPGSIIWDIPLEYTEADGSTFQPINFDERYRGPVTIRSALANSMNVPAFHLADQLGVASLLDGLHLLGITSMRDSAAYGPALTLGGGDVSLLDLAYAYSVLANNGIMRGQPTLLDLPPNFRELDPVAILDIRDPAGNILYSWDEPEERAVARPQQVYQITDILADNNARSLLYGLESNLVLDRPAAAKTGTAGDPGINDVRRDYWTLGYTPHIVAGVWVGNADNTPMTGGSSSRTAGLIWRKFMLAAHDRLPPADFVEPPGLVRAPLHAPQLSPYNIPAADQPLQDPCARIVDELFTSLRVVPDPENGICFDVRLDARTRQLAAPRTEERHIIDGVFLQPPLIAEPGATDPDPDAIEWLRDHRVAFIQPGAADPSDAPVRIDAPADNAVLQRGPTVIAGRAESPDLTQWTLTARQIRGETDTIELAASDTPAPAGLLARWDTRDLPDGLYFLTLTVVDRHLGPISEEIVVALPHDDAPSPELFEDAGFIADDEFETE